PVLREQRHPVATHDAIRFQPQGDGTYVRLELAMRDRTPFAASLVQHRVGLVVAVYGFEEELDQSTTGEIRRVRGVGSGPGPHSHACPSTSTGSVRPGRITGRARWPSRWPRPASAYAARCSTSRGRAPPRAPPSHARPPA